MSDALRSQVCAWIVDDAGGNTALFKDHMRAEQYVTHVLGGHLDGMVRLRDALAAMSAAGCRRGSDETGA